MSPIPSLTDPRAVPFLKIKIRKVNNPTRLNDGMMSRGFKMQDRHFIMLEQASAVPIGWVSGLMRRLI